MIKVSVIIPVYNVSAYIQRNVQSLMRQTLKEVQYIFVDDATPDDSIEVIRKELESFPERAAVSIVSH